MKIISFLLITAIFFTTACSTYKSSQTPDDVYYSPGSVSKSGNSDYYSTANDQYVRMRVQDPDRWSYFDDYNYDYYGGYNGLGYSPYSPYGTFGFNSFVNSGFGFGYYSPFTYWNSYYSWNSFYNPYYSGIVVVNGKAVSPYGYTSLSTFSPASYSNHTYYRSANNASYRTPYSYSETIRRNYNNPNASYYRPGLSSRTDGSNFSQPSRNSYSPAPLGGSFRSSGGGGGGGGMSRPSHR